MAEFLRYRMRPQDDLSVRTDFTADLMNAAKSRLQDILDGSEEILALRSKAAVDIRITGSLSDINIEVNVVPTPESDMTREEADEQQEIIGKMVNEKFSGVLGEILQEGIDTARRRM